MLDAIVSRDWEDRYYSFDARWGAGEEVGSMRDGCGNDWFIHFALSGVAIKGLEHETPIARSDGFAAEVQRRVPRAFSSFLAEPAFTMDQLSFCYWRGRDDVRWQKVVHSDPALAASGDGSLELLAPLCEPSSAYAGFANEYYELELPPAAIDAIYGHVLLSAELVWALVPGMTVAELREDAVGIGYPVGS